MGEGVSRRGRVLASVVLTGAALFDAGPLGFIPPLVRFPLLAVALAGCWWGPAQQPRGQRWLEGIALGAIFANWLLLRAVGLHPSRADDGIYFYLAEQLGRGAVPYRDFFFAHPPVHLIVPAVVFKVFGFSLVLAKALPALLQTGAAVLLYLTVRPASRALAVLGVALHLSSYQVLMGATDLTGANLVTFFLIAALWAAWTRRPLTAGVMAALALGSGLYALAGVLVIAGVSWRRRTWARSAGGFGLGLAGWIAPFALLAGDRFWDGVVRYHLAKPAGAERGAVFSGDFPGALLGNLSAWLGGDAVESFYFHAAQCLAAAVALGALIVLRKQKEEAPSERAARELAAVGLVAVLLFALQWAGLAELYEYYTVPQISFLALPAAYGMWRTFLLLQQAEVRRERVAAAAFCAVLLLTPMLANVARGALWPAERARAGEAVRYRWTDPWVPAPLASLVRAVYFAPERQRDSPQPGWRHFVWNKSLTVSTAESMSEFVRSRTTEEETIAGASTLAPLIALLSDRRLAGDEADTNAKRFRTGSLTDRGFFEAACKDNVRYLIAAPRAYFTEQQLARQPTVAAWFEREREFIEPSVRHGGPERYVFFRRKDLPPGSRCAFVEQ